MNNLHISTSKKLKDAKPSEVRRVGFLKLWRRYEYDFTDPSEYWRVLGKNRTVKLEKNNAVTGGILSGGATV